MHTGDDMSICALQDPVLALPTNITPCPQIVYVTPRSPLFRFANQAMPPPDCVLETEYIEKR
jgi:hypothetical protein